MGGWRDGPSYKFALVQKLSTVTKTKKPGGGSSLAHRMGQGVDWPEPAPKASAGGEGQGGSQPAVWPASRGGVRSGWRRRRR